MNALIIILAQTKSGATIVILFLLLVAAIIGYLTAWLFYKSVYVKKIRIIETEREELKTKIVNLNADKSNLQKSLTEKDRNIEHLNREVSAHNALQEEAVHYSIAEKKHHLDYKSFGTATEADKDDLKMISGIGPVIEYRLNSLNIYTFLQISKFAPKDIDTLNDTIIYFSGRIERDEWVAQAKELVISKEKRKALFKRISDRKDNIKYNRIGVAKKEEEDDLTIINGIGGWIKEKLNALDIYTFRQISNFTEEDVKEVTEAIEFFPGRIERDEWIHQARELVQISGKKAELLRHIRERKDRIYYDRLGIAHKHQANNLTLIKGIGLWIEERLNMLDIYTFKQISKLTPQDVDIITEILKIPPGRIDRDDWIAQAGDLAKTIK